MGIDWFGVVALGVGMALAGAGIVATVRNRMDAIEQWTWQKFGAVLFVGGIAIAVYGLSMRGGGSGSEQPPVTITQTNPHSSPNFINPQTNQTMTDSPGGVQVQVQGDNNTVNQGLQPRKLTPVQEERFVQVLKDNPKGHVAISCIESGGPEPCNFARQLKGLLESQDAGWTVTFSPLMFAAGDPTKTIPSLYLEAQTNAPPPFAFALREALKAALGHEPVCLIRADQPSNFLQLTVSHNSP